MTTRDVSHQAASGEAIPREYHRKILKKIAQLTKVIYVLNTKNGEHDEFVERLRSQHEQELRRVEGESMARLEHCQQLCLADAEGQKEAVGKLKEQLSIVEGEREQLLQSQTAYRKEVGEHLASLNSRHKAELEQVTTALQKLRSDQQGQLKQLAELKNSFSKKADEKVAELVAKHNSELMALEKQAKDERESARSKLHQLRQTHEEEMKRLQLLQQTELEGHEKRLAAAQAELLEEKRRRKEREESMTCQFTQNEEELKLSISSLTFDLRTARDSLALSEQRVRDLEACCEASHTDSSGTRKQLEAALEEVKNLQASISDSNAELEVSREQCKEQNQEIELLSATVRRLESERSSNEELVSELSSQLAGLEHSLATLQREKEELFTTNHSTQEQHSTRIKALEKELGRARREKEELHTQFAHEIEAAHSKLSEREDHLSHQHITALEEVKAQHMTSLAETKASSESALASLSQELAKQGEEQLDALRAAHSHSIARLESSLEERALELLVATEQIDELQKELQTREEGLGSASGELSRVMAELVHAKSELASAMELCKEKEAACKQLEALVGQLRREMTGKETEHAKALKEAKSTLTRQLEQTWTLRLKQECDRVSSELSEQHRLHCRTAVEELGRVKDSQLAQAREEWEGQHSRLAALIAELEERLRQEQLSNSSSAEHAKRLSNEQLASLRGELEAVGREHAEQLDTLRQSHRHNVTSLEQKHDSALQAACEGLRQQQTEELLVVHQTHWLAVQSLRDQLEQEKRADSIRAEEEHQEELMALRCELLSRHQAEVEGKKEKHSAQMQEQRTSLLELLDGKQRKLEQSECSAAELQKTLMGKEAELSQLRSKVNSLTVATSDLRKELEVKGQEVLAVRREVTNQLKIREQQLISSHRAELAASNADHRGKTQSLLADFNQARSLLAARLSETEKLLAAAELRYKSRDSRPEDLQTIRELKAIVKEHEHKMRELVAEKRIYQLELMNREKNYNKVFSANPQIGVLDPLEYKNKKDLLVAKATTRHSSAPSLTSPTPEGVAAPPPLGSRRLAPLDDSPLTLKRRITKSKPISNSSGHTTQSSTTHTTTAAAAAST